MFFKTSGITWIFVHNTKSINQAIAEKRRVLLVRFVTCKLELVLVTLLDLSKWLYCSCESGHRWWLSNLQMCHTGQGGY